jgi:VWFA-related protein
MRTFRLSGPLFLVAHLIALVSFAVGQPEPSTAQQNVRTVTIPISIFTKKELEQNQTEEYVQADRLMVKEDRDDQTILSIRSVSDTPLTVAFLVQDDLTSEFNLQLKSIGDFIRTLPRGSRVMVAYMRTGSLQIRQKFTDDLSKAASSLRIVGGTASVAPRSPYDSVTEALNRFDALPAGRRAIVMFSDGLDSTQGLSLISAINTPDLEKAILRAQRKSVAVYSIYSPATFTQTENGTTVLAGQGGLEKLADGTGGRAFFQGSIAPVSLDPFFQKLSLLLSRQFALTYLSTHMKKGYHRIEVRSTNPEVKIEHPKGYYYR